MRARLWLRTIVSKRNEQKVLGVLLQHLSSMKKMSRRVPTAPRIDTKPSADGTCIDQHSHSHEQATYSAAAASKSMESNCAILCGGEQNLVKEALKELKGRWKSAKKRKSQSQRQDSK
jgi:hypothetical protein